MTPAKKGRSAGKVVSRSTGRSKIEIGVVLKPLARRSAVGEAKVRSGKALGLIHYADVVEPHATHRVVRVTGQEAKSAGFVPLLKWTDAPASPWALQVHPDPGAVGIPLAEAGEIALHDVVVNGGVPAETVPALAEVLDLPLQRIAEGLGLATSTLNRRRNSNEALSAAESDPVLHLARLVAKVREWPVADEVRANGFDAGVWLGQWLTTRHSTLKGREPISLLATSDGRRLVERLLESSVSGAYW